MYKVEIFNNETDEIANTYLVETFEDAFKKVSAMRDEYFGYRIWDYATNAIVDFSINL